MAGQDTPGVVERGGVPADAGRGPSRPPSGRARAQDSTIAAGWRSRKMNWASGQQRANLFHMNTWLGVFSTSTDLPLLRSAWSSIRSHSMWVSSAAGRPSSPMLFSA
ncbi:hypothetical protein Prum_018310 [Phytohabitans rumicis]|uniref:Uncharacterized protein n=1 Tax=Phytohabitans rumicis TaxID=1076125 RepID=A0A6V8L0R1_9ACTN|nr:hypothetical protein Prum_018310 [Phytohabitans rumicis]